MGLYNQFRLRVKDGGFIEEGDRILLGFSGGGDSVALAHLLRSMQKDLSFYCAIAHVAPYIIHNSYDQRECQKKIQWVKDFSIKYQFQLHQHSHSLGPSNYESQARAYRYDFFKKIMHQFDYLKLFLAHHQDDQVETFFLSLMRSGRISTMKFREYFQEMNVSVIRPLIEFPKSHIYQFLLENNFSYFTDVSNLNVKYRRNALRLQVLPFVEKVFPEYRRFVERCAKRFRLLESVFDVYLRGLCDKLILKRDDFEIIVSVALLRRCSYEIQEAFLRMIFRDLFSSYPRFKWNYDCGSFDEMLRKLHSHKSGTHVLLEGSGLFVYLEYDHLVFELQPLYSYEIKNSVYLYPYMVYLLFRRKNVSYKLALDYSCNVDQSIFESFFSDGLKKSCCIFDVSIIEWPVILRELSEDDFIELGDSKHKKVSALLIDKKIPRRCRHLVRVIQDSTQILAVIDPVINNFLWFLKRPYRKCTKSSIFLVSLFKDIN